jgi:hypothetical protein
LAEATASAPVGRLYAVEHPLFRAACSVLGVEHAAARALARAVESDDSGDWHMAKELLSDLPEAQWVAIKGRLKEFTLDEGDAGAPLH